MTVQNVTLSLSESVMQRARQAADALQHPIEEVLVSVLAAALPDMEGIPLSMRADLARMTWLNDQELWGIARSVMTDAQQRQLDDLTQVQSQRSLTEEEQRKLVALREQYGRVTLRKARAYALLSLRGGHPLLAGN